MIQRCCNQKHPRYAEWGGKGIRVCKRWRLFRNFFADMGVRPMGLTLERKKNWLGYSPRNCIWATARDQQRNTKRSIWVRIGGKRLCLKEWCEQLDIKYQTVFVRINRGMTPREALIRPVQKRK